MKPLHRRVALTLCALVCGACLTVSCAQILGIERLPEKCDSNEECEYLGGWICNQTTHFCEPPAAGNGCEDDDECRADAPICGEDNKCRGCQGNDECDAAAPICGLNGQCMAGCTASTQCSEATPYCNTAVGMCEACMPPRDDALCSERDPQKPLCGPAGTCVACLDSAQCTEDAPICGATNTCEPCKQHSDCASYSCVCADDGACVPESAVVYVRKASGADTGDCSQDAPCQTLTYASVRIQADNANKRYIRILDSESYSGVAGGSLTFSGIDVAIIGNNASISSIDNNKPIVDIGADAQVALEGVTLQSIGTGVNGVACRFNDSSIRLENVTIQENRGIGIDVSNCPLTVERSLIIGNEGGGISVTSAAFDVTNSYIVGNGSATAEIGGVLILNGTSRTPQRFAFNTVIDNVVGTAASASGVSCTVPAADNDNGKLTATSNIIAKDAGSQPPAAAGNCKWHYSNIEAGDTLGDIASADNNNNYGDCALVDTGDGVLAITAGTPCENTGEPGTGILVDHDGAPRSADAPDMGADEL